MRHKPELKYLQEMAEENPAEVQISERVKGQDDIMSVLLANEKRGGAGGSGSKPLIPGQQDSGSDSSDEDMQVIPKMAEPSPGEIIVVSHVQVS